MKASLHSLDALAPARIELWNRLLALAATPSPFLSHAFSSAVHVTRGGVRVLQLDTEEGETGFLPFQLRAGRGFLGHAEKVGGSLSDAFGIVGPVRTRLDPQELLSHANISSLRFDHAIPDQCPFAYLDAEAAAGVRVRIDDFGSYMRSLVVAQKEFVKTVDRAGRRLEREVGKLSFSWCSANGALELAHLISRKREQYHRTRHPDGFRQSWRRALLHRLMQTTDPLCQPILSTLHCGDQWVASNLSLACNETLHVWFPVFNPDFRRYGPGHLLFFRIFEHGSAHGIRWFDFGEGEAVYKSRYHGESYPLRKGVIRQPSIRGYSERVLQSIQWQIQKRFSGNRSDSRRTQMPVGSDV